jgi:hypothetical protein
VPGDWLLQIESNEKTTCTLSNEVKSSNFTILEDRSVVECNAFFVDLGSCGGFSFPAEPIDVKCDNTGVTLSLIRNIDNEYYFESQLDNRPETTLTATDYCYGRTQSGSDCHADSTAWTLLALDGTEYATYSNPFLKSQASTPLHYFALETIDKSSEIQDRLVATLDADGSFNQDGFYTALAYLALAGSAKADEVALANTWLETNLGDTGINSNTKQTAAALYALNPSIIIPSGPVCGDNLVNRAIEECDGTSDALCPDSCGSPGTLNACTCVDSSITTVFIETSTTTIEDEELGRCDVDEYNSGTCKCGSDTVSSGYCCVDEDEDKYGSDDECVEPSSGGGFLKILIGVLLLIVGAGVIYYFVKKKGISGKGLFKKKPKSRPARNMKMPPRTPQPQFRQAFQPGQRRPVSRARTPDQDVEDQLDKSIAEAKKLLKRND